MTGYIPNEGISLRVKFIDLGIDIVLEPESPGLPPPPAPPIPAVYYQIADYIKDFEHRNERVLCWILYDIEHLIKHAHPEVIDKNNAEFLLAEAIHNARRFMVAPPPTPEECYELERWVDFLPDAYDACVKRYDLWNAQRAADHERRSAAAKKGVETRRRNREAAKAS